MTVREQATAARDAQAQRSAEVNALYAKVAADPAGRQVIAHILEDLCDPEFVCAGLQARGDAFMARYRAASRIQLAIARGRQGT